MGPLKDTSLASLDQQTHVVSGRFSVSLRSVKEFLAVLASWAENIFDDWREQECFQLLQDVGLLFVVACVQVSCIIVRRSYANENSTERSTPPVLPQKLVKLSSAEPSQMLAIKPSGWRSASLWNRLMPSPTNTRSCFVSFEGRMFFVKVLPPSIEVHHLGLLGVSCKEDFLISPPTVAALRPCSRDRPPSSQNSPCFVKK